MFPANRFAGLVGPPRASFPRVLVPPGVYRPKTDSKLLAAALAREPIEPETSVLDMCAGSGAIGLAAASLGAGQVTSIDISALAVWTARFNARIRGVQLRVHVGGIAQACQLGPFDVVLANPPYVPCPAPTAARHSPRWDAGPAGRHVLDQLCAAADTLLSAAGTILIVQSAFAGEAATAAALRAHGLATAVVGRARVPFGPIVSLRSRYLLRNGLWDGAVKEEELVVIRGQRG